ncbi:hypothetical protein E8E12_002007 [Didymella heteroderae]|uniref:Fungal N-terminal domain-containing protein n=1 Tax=Didymella heteroderae TaxID=1769908 RepID=A0A9P4WUJ2_9PLEO|nr:hypothetical protein E8E12_002007 [Didymella heteroderae]
MAEIFGAVAAGIAVGSELIRLGCAIQRSIERIKNSRKDVEDLATETIIFAGLYQKFLRACGKDRHVGTTDVPAVLPLIKWAEETLAKLKKLLRKVEGLYPQMKPRTKWEDTFIALIVWFGSSSKVQALRNSLSVARESIIGFTNLMCLDELKIQVKLLKEALRDRNKRRELEDRLGVTLEDRIREINQEIHDMRIIHRENRKTLAKAQVELANSQKIDKTTSLIPASEALRDLIETLEDYADELLPSRHPRSRDSNYSHASTASGKDSIYSLLSRGTQPEFASEPIMSDATGTEKSSTTTSLVSSHDSSRSLRGPPRASSSLSTVSILSLNAPNGALPRSSRAEVTIESPYTRREYMNDPQGTILSPPMVRPTSSPTLLAAKTARIGDYLITLEAKRLRINRHSLQVNDYDIGLAFFEALKQHPQELDSLDAAIGRRDEDWGGIPGWVVNPSNWTV